MRFEIHHTLDYRYSEPVTIHPTTLRLRPRSDGVQMLESFSLDLSVDTAERSESIDLYDNPSVRVWFDQPHDRIRYDMRCRVATTRDNPFDFLLEREAQQLPMQLDYKHLRQLAVYLDAAGTDPDVAEFAEQVAAENQQKPLDTAIGMARAIADRSTWTVRPTGAPWRPEKTLADREGSCRDLAMLFIAAVRSIGLPARFVSGYQHQQAENAKLERDAADGIAHELHAWAEVFLPGAGWRGFDPSAGVLAADHHIVVAAAPDHTGTMPTEGAYRGGSNVTSELEAKVTIKQLDDLDGMPNDVASPAEAA